MTAFSFFEEATLTGFALLLGLYGSWVEPPKAFGWRVILRIFNGLALTWLIIVLIVAADTARKGAV